MMELFTLGHGSGYTEDDVREQARALTGFRYDWTQDGPTNFRYDASYHDKGVKKIFGQSGHFKWQDSCRLCVSHPAHSPFFVEKLWSYFVPVPPDSATQHALQKLYVSSGHAVRPVLEAILKHPTLFEGPRLVKPPVVYTAGLLRRIRRGIDTTAWTWLDAMSGQQLFYPPNVAGMLRAVGRGIDTQAWAWLCESAGQYLFMPPNVSGWDDTRWLDTATWRGRWWIAQYALDPYALDPAKAGKPDNAKKLLDSALSFWHEPQLGKPTRQALQTFAHRALGDASGTDWKKQQYPPMVVNALRQLIAVSPELQAA
jgi:uncharacterized protein (DUF1800 family)